MWEKCNIKPGFYILCYCIKKNDYYRDRGEWKERFNEAFIS